MSVSMSGMMWAMTLSGAVALASPAALMLSHAGLAPAASTIAPPTAPPATATDKAKPRGQSGSQPGNRGPLVITSDPAQQPTTVGGLEGPSDPVAAPPADAQPEADLKRAGPTDAKGRRLGVVIGNGPVCIGDVMPAVVSLQAFRVRDSVLVVARGSNPTGGFQTALERVHWNGGARVVLRNVPPPPGSFVTEAFTGFDVSGYVRVRRPINDLTITIAGRHYRVPVQDIDEIPLVDSVR